MYQDPEKQVDPPLGILHLATLAKNQHEVRIFDGQLFSNTPQRMAQEVLDWEPDVVGFSVNYSTVAQNSRKMAELIHSEGPNISIIFGGNYATFNWENLINLSYVNYIVLHEAELSFMQLLTHISNQAVPLPSGTISKGLNGSYQVRPFDKYVSNLDDLDFCDYDLFDDSVKYVKSIVTSRGCPFSCIYCSTKAMWGKWRCRSASNVTTEMLMLADKYSSNQIFFADDNFLVQKQRALDICDILKVNGGHLLWGFSTRIELISEKIIPILARSDCGAIFFGVESGSPQVLNKMERHYTPDEVVKIIQLCADNGITCTASFIVGLPWESERDVKATFDLMKKVPTHRVLLNIFSPLLGTPSLNNPEKFGISFLDQPNPEQMVVGHGHVRYNTKYLQANQIRELWLEGQGIVMAKGRQKHLREAEIERNRYGLLSLPELEKG